MNHRNQEGFSLIELLIVVVVVGIITALAVPSLRKGVWAAESGNTVATLRTLSSTQAGFYSQRERFGRLDELNPLMGNALGAVNNNEAIRYQYVIAMVPQEPTDAELRNGYTILATRNIPSDGLTYQYEITHTGELRQIQP